MSLKKRLKKAQNKPRFEFLEDPTDKEQWLVKLLVKPWNGIIYKYLEIKPVVDKEKDIFRFSFQYDIIKLPKRLQGKVFEDEQKSKFETLIGQIAFELYENKIKENLKKQNAKRPN